MNRLEQAFTTYHAAREHLLAQVREEFPLNSEVEHTWTRSGKEYSAYYFVVGYDCSIDIGKLRLSNTVTGGRRSAMPKEVKLISKPAEEGKC